MSDTGTTGATYTPEQVEQARQQLASMTPVDLLNMQDYIRSLQEQTALPEAGGSATAMVIGVGGAEVLLTARGVNVDIAWDELNTKLAAILSAGGFPIKRYTSEYDVPGAPRDATSLPQTPVVPVDVRTQPAPTPQPVPVQPQPQPQPTSVPIDSGVLSFPAVTLEATMRGGTAYWSVKGTPGGPFGKYGVRIWPEVLEAAGIINPDPTKKHNVQGWTAEYIVGDSGKPKKVVALIAPRRQ